MEENKINLKEYFRALKGISLPWKALVVIFLSSLLSTYAGLNLSFFTGDMVDALGNVPTRKLVKYGASYLGIGLAAALSTLGSARASEHVNLGIREKLWKKIMYTNAKYYDKDGGESLISRVTTDCDFASKLLTCIVEFISLTVSGVIYVSQMFRLNTKMALAMMFLIPLSTLIGWGYAKICYLIGQKTQQSLANTTTYLAERTQNLNLIKTSNAKEEEIRRGLECFELQYEMSVKTQLLNTFYIALQHVFSILCTVVPFIIGAKLVSDHVIRAGTVIAFYSIAGTVGTMATNFIEEVGIIKNANGALSRVISVLRLPDEREASGKETEDTVKDINITNISFAYGDKEVLHTINCVIPNGKITAIVGTNGSGKSTLFKLIDRILDPTDGSVFYGETDAKEYDLHAWRKQFCYVAQDSPLMEGTIRENILYGCEKDVTEEELMRVIKLAKADEFISELPDGLDTKIACGATNLSGGQKQCLAIARALVQDAKILLLDEATSSLDCKREHMVMDALQELMKGRTTIIIAHSLTTIQNADHVIVMHNGMIEEQDSFENIMKKPGNYLSKLACRCRTN
ncbi:MAG: ABC transporter ATP-binding protein [Erysipelotrichaceae bacterium]|nr:ABC transporter ATP-binding protein [Erysipelotrichaceae bacterium]